MNLIIMTTSPENPLAWHAYWLCAAMQQANHSFEVFFYKNACHIANRLCYQPADRLSLQNAWQQLNIDLPICVSAALHRGITDELHAVQHELSGDNLHAAFRLTGLGELADKMARASRVISL